MEKTGKLPGNASRAKETAWLLSTGFGYDFGIARLSNGGRAFFKWGQNLPKGDMLPDRKYVYIGMVWDGDTGKRENFAEEITYINNNNWRG